MIHNPFALVCVLAAIEALVLFLSRHERTKAWFGFLPPVFWIYFLPMLASSFGLIDAKSPVYSLITTNLLPASLVLLLLPVDIRSILHLGPTALLMFFIGSAGVIAGTVISFVVFKHWVGPEFWAGFGALSASWTGGSANMVAVKEALAVPDRVFLPMVIVDTVVPYIWMGSLIALVGFQAAFDRWNRSDRRILDDLGRKVQDGSCQASRQWRWQTIILILAVAAAGGWAAQLVASQLPQVKDVVSTYAWTIIVVSVIGIALSFTPARKLEDHGASRTGYFLLYFVLTSIGARASIANVGSSLVLIAAGFLIVLVHAAFLLVGARLLKAPLFLVAAASQANIGGVASAPVVAEVYQPGLASVGLLLAILGNIVGTYLGILCGQLCRFFT